MDAEAIFQDVQKVISFSQDIKNPKVEILKNKWLEAKRDFIELFGGEPIYKIPNITVHFELSENEKNQRFDDFNDMVSGIWNNDALANFIYDMRKDFYSNITTKDYQYGDIKIPKGMKIVKAFKFFEKDKKLLDEIQTYASRIIQEDKMEGELCFSVHPLDFLSSSENTYNWRSCHSLDGEYRAGNLSYMLDSSTMICYLSSKEKQNLPNFPKEVPWNSKKWRMLLFWEDNWNSLLAGRQYPFATKSGLDYILEQINKNFKQKFIPWSNKKFSMIDGKVLDEEYIIINNHLHTLKDIVNDAKNSHHFNDLLYSSCYTPYYTSNEKQYFYKKPVFHIGSEVSCLNCGKDLIILKDTMLCPKCELEYNYHDNDKIRYCECCNRRILIDEAYPVLLKDNEYQYVCSYCAISECAKCDLCGKLVYSDNIKFDRKTKMYLCSDCCKDNELEV